MSVASFTAVVLSLLALGIAMPGQAQTPATLDRIREAGAISVGYRPSAVPFSYEAVPGKPIGYAIDLCAKVIEAVKWELKLPDLEVRYEPVSSENRIARMREGATDIECGSTTDTAERQEQVSFSVSYFTASVRMMVRKDSGFKDLDELNGERIVVTSGTTADDLLREYAAARRLDVRIEYGQDNEASFRAVESRRAAAFVLDDVLLASLIAESRQPSDFAIVGPSLSCEPYGLMLPKGDAEFKSLVDRTLIGLFKSGEAEKLYSRWFTGPIPPKQIDLAFPASSLLMRAFDIPTDGGGACRGKASEEHE